ncbi:MAG: PadR family transcriptional regulator [Candidatus Aquicultorales bacterium]
MSVRNALLGLLEQKPRYGYELHAAFEAFVGEDNWEVKPAQVYTTLGRLKERGLVNERAMEQDGGADKRVFTITPAGRKELAEWLAAPVKAGHQRDEFFLKFMLAVVTGRANPRKVIYAQRASLFQELHDLTIQRSAVDPSVELSRILLLDRAIMHLEADLRWLDMIEARYDEVRIQPIPEPKRRPRGRPPRRK